MSTPLLGEYVIPLTIFPSIDSTFSQFDAPPFKQLSARKRFRRINEVLLDQIHKAPKEAYLLPAVVDYINRINQKKTLEETYHIALFEFWLNHYSELSSEDNTLVRAKIAGKYLPRDAYQAFFPIGMGKTFTGTHFVVAHLSPDVDTTIASFWGWLDAFAARVCDRMHIWSLPGGPPESPVIQLFRDLFGNTSFANLSRSAGAQTLSAMDLVTQKNLIKEKPGISISTLDHGFNEKAVLLIDDQGHYLGDWRGTDVEPVRQIIILFKACLRWFETNLHLKLIEMFAKKDLSVDDIPNLLTAVFDVSLEDCEPVQEFGDQQREDLDALLVKVFGLPTGLKSTFTELNEAFERASISDLSRFRKELESLRTSNLFDSTGYVVEDRSLLFNRLKELLRSLNTAIHRIRDFVEGLDIAMEIKSKVLGKTLHYLTMRSEVEDIRIKMSNYNYLTVVVPEDNGQLYPVGIVWANDLRKPILGTVSYRDFCNPEEVKMASYLSVISVIDHHKSSLRTFSPPMALIGDAQSCNVLVAEQTLAINESYSQGGMSIESILAQFTESMEQNDSSAAGLRRKQRLLKRRMAAETRGNYYVHPLREMTEYLLFVHAIFDDTDLLTKVSGRDVECMAALLNRMKSISMQQEIEIINLDDIAKDENFAKTAAKRILQHPDVYSLYRRIFASREQEVATSLQALAERRPSNFFADIKEQNGCCRVGQAKMFTSNFPVYYQSRDLIKQQWLTSSQEVYRAHPEIDLHLMMISTVASADEVYKDVGGQYDHKDELWIWVPERDQAHDHLASFLSAFQTAREILNNRLELNLPEVGETLAETFARNFIPVATKRSETLPIAVINYLAGTLNSRKAMISPYLPRLVP